MPLVKNYRTYPIIRDRNGEFHIIAGPRLEDRRGPFDTEAEAREWVDQELARITNDLGIRPHGVADIGTGDGDGRRKAEI